MKSFKDVEATRRDYHRDAALNSVHRSSLMVPEMAGAAAEISFVNHFLLKRGYDRVGCRITALDPEGERIESRLHEIREPKVYTLPLSGMVAEPTDTYLVEFFTAENLFIPFPAVMVNHHGDNFLNMVHAYNRVLNDVFEDDSINARPVAEASIDVRLDDKVDTFVTFTTGLQPCRGEIEIELADETGVRTKAVPVDQPRLTNRHFSIAELFSTSGPAGTGVLKVRQPQQFLFYGRMLAGQRASDGAFSANHSYYDSSLVAEYWDDERPSWRVYPFFRELDNIVRMYPIMSPGRLAASIELFTEGGGSLGTIAAGELDSPGSRGLEVPVNEMAEADGYDLGAIASFALIVSPKTGNTPTRVNHQLVHSCGGLSSSVNMSLNNPNIFAPAGKKGFAWGQTVVGRDHDCWLGFAADRPGGDPCDVQVTFFGDEGELASRRWVLPPNGAVCIDPEEELAAELRARDRDRPSNIWYIAQGARPDLSAYTVVRDRRSGHCTGEHNF